MTTPADVLRRVAALGPYFALEPVPSHADGWRPLAALVDGGAATERVAHTRAVLSARTRTDVELRVAASITFLGLAARLVAPPLAAAALAGQVPEPGAVWWRPVDGGPVPTAWADVRVRRAEDAAAAAGALADGIVTTSVAPLADTFGRRFALSPKVLWGNVASALGGAAGMIAAAGSDLVLDPADIVAEVLHLGPLRGTAAYADGQMVRNNCCLFYRVPGGGRCADCVLLPR